MARHLLLVLLLWCTALPGMAAEFNATSDNFSTSYLSTNSTAGEGAWRIYNDKVSPPLAPVAGAFVLQANSLLYNGISNGIGIQAAGVASDNPSYDVLGTSLDMILARATDNQGIYVVARSPGDLLITPALLVPLNPSVAMTWTAAPWGPDYAAHLGETLSYEVVSLAATAPRSGLAGCLKIEETNSYNSQKRTFYWKVGTPWPVEVQDDRSFDAGPTLSWTATPVADVILPADPVGVWVRQGGNLAIGEYRMIAFFANGTWGRFQRLAAQNGTSLWQIGTWRVTVPGTIETTVTYRVGNPLHLDGLGSINNNSFSQSPTGALTFNGETYDRTAQTGMPGAYWFGQDPDGFGVIADLDGLADSGDEPWAGLAVFANNAYVYWEDDGSATVGSEWGTTANMNLSGFDATVVGDENGFSGFSTGAMFAMFNPGGLLASSILPGMGVGIRIAGAEFPVLYNSNGATSGTAPTQQFKVQGVTLELRTNSGTLERTGFTFDGWNSAANGSGTAYAEGASYTANAPAILFAAWTPITYAVTYDGNGATSGTTPGSQVKVQGVTLELRTNSGALTRTGFTFAGWNTAANGLGTPYTEGASYTTDAAITLFAAWTPIPTFAVTYDGNGATSGTVPGAQVKVQGVTLVLSTNSGTLARTGFTFAGWNTAADGLGTPYAEGASYTADATVTLFAAWTPIPTYAVTYDSNGSTSGTAPGSQVKVQGVTLVLSNNSGTLARTGFTFAGWNTAADGLGTPYAEGGNYTTDAAVTLFATWTPNPTYAVTYDGNGATSGTAPGSQVKVQGVTLVLSTNSGTLARAGFTFAGWNTATDGLGTPYAEGASYTADAAVTLFAAWTPIPTFSVTYDSNGATSGTAPGAQVKVQGVTLVLSTNSGTLARTGFTFAGWNTAADGSGTAYAEGANYTADAAVTLHAAWTPIPTYAVTYDGNGATTGTPPAGQTKTLGVNLTLSASIGGLGKTAALFGGWNTAANGSGTTYMPGDVYTLDAPLTLFAIWTAVPGGGSPSFGFVDGNKVRQVIGGDRVSLPLRVSPNLNLELLASVVITTPFAGLDAANGNWPSPAGTASSLELISSVLYQRLAPGVTEQALVLTIPSGVSGTMTISFGPEVQGLINTGLTSSVVIRAASTTPMTDGASAYVAGQNLSPFSVQAGDTLTQQALSGTAASGPQDLNLVAVNGTPPYTATVQSGSAEIRPWKPFVAAVDWDLDGNADTGQWFTIVPRSAGIITIRISDSVGQSRDSNLTVAAGASGSATVNVPASSGQETVYTLAGAAGFGGVDALLARFQGNGANSLVRRGFVYGPQSKAWFELPTLPTEGKPLPWDGFYLADRTGEDLNLTVEALGVPPYIPLYPGWNVLALPPLRQGSGAVLPSISATDLDLYDEFGNTIARSAFSQVMGQPQTWNGSTFVTLTTIAVGQGFFLKNNLSGANPRMLYLVPGRQALSGGARQAKSAENSAKAISLKTHTRETTGGTEIVPTTGIMGQPPAPPASSSTPPTSSSGGGCGGGSAAAFLLLSLGLLFNRRQLLVVRVARETNKSNCNDSSLR
jgi:uncharacterized repeat protein (TIGR02543 family)